MNSKISNERKFIYYIGIILIAFGFILFMSSFFCFYMELPVFGMICMIAGSILSLMGRSGPAGSGILLDPEKAREDLRPFNESKGKMINDVIENIDIFKNVSQPSKEKIEVIKIKCRECSELNDEDAKFCKGCGNPL